MQDLPTSYWATEQIEKLNARVTALEEELGRYRKLIEINDYNNVILIKSEVQMDGNYLVNAILENCGGIMTGGMSREGE